MNNIILIGMPGAGKSTIGIALAKEIGYDLIDTDEVIIDYAKKPLQEIIDSTSVEEFLDIERDAILTLKCENTIVATGGSVIYREEAMEYLKTLGKVIYLRLPFCVINNRINNLESRGIAMGPGQTLKTLYDERTPLYEKYCDVRLNCNNKNVAKIVKMICEEME